MHMAENVPCAADHNHSCPLHFQGLNVISKDFALLLTDLSNQMVNLGAMITFDLTSTQLAGMSTSARLNGWDAQQQQTSGFKLSKHPSIYDVIVLVCDFGSQTVCSHILAALQSLQAIKACRLGLCSLWLWWIACSLSTWVGIWWEDMAWWGVNQPVHDLNVLVRFFFARGEEKSQDAT